jgi:hypothetical protein
MGNIQVTSTTDSPEAVMAAVGNLAPKEEIVVEETENETKGEEKPPETLEESEEEVEASEDDEPEEERPKKKGGFKRRIEKLNSKISQAEQEREYWRQQALKAQAQPQAKPQATPEGKPSPENFESHDDYVEALTDWKLDQKLQAQSVKQRESQIKSEHQARVDAHINRVQAFAKNHEDFEEAMEDVDDIPISIAVQEIILESENGPELMYELAKNRKEFERICALPALAAARALGRFESKLSKQQETKTTKAPPPIRPVGSKSSSGVNKKPEDMDFQEYKRWRAQNS